MEHQHEQTEAVVRRLSRAIGHLQAVKRMVEEGRDCADVLTQEPHLPTCPLLSAPRAYITPHMGWATPEARSRILAILEANIRGFIAGTPQNVVRP